MSLTEAYGWVFGGMAGVMAAGWYAYCWFVMLFRAQSINAYFSMAYVSSGLFAMANFLIVINFAAFGLHWFTQ